MRVELRNPRRRLEFDGPIAVMALLARLGPTRGRNREEAGS